MGVTKRGASWYLKWKDASGEWRRQVCTARTKHEAQVLLSEIVRQVDRQKRGLEAQPIETGMSVWGACEWWHGAKCKPRSKRSAGHMLNAAVKDAKFARLPLTAVTPEAVDAHLDVMEQLGYAPRTINQVRVLISGVFTHLKRARMWAGENPVRGTRRRSTDKTPRPVLKPEEVEDLLAKVPENWRGFFAAAVFLGLRKGELCGLLKGDYDRVRRTIYVGRSYGYDTTKGDRVDYLPVSKSLAPYLEAALESPGLPLFPNPKGTRRNHNASPERVLRRAFRRLGWITGWMHKCRWCPGGKTAAEKLASGKWIRNESPEQIRCPRCKRKMWPVGIARPMRFHDLRHTAATHLLQMGVPIQHVQRILRHKSIQTTLDTYGHLMTEDLRSAVEKLGPASVQPTPLRRVT